MAFGAVSGLEFGDRAWLCDDRLLLYGVFVEQDGNQHCGWDGDHGADNSIESCTEKQGDDHSKAGEIDAGAHDARGKERGFNLSVDGVKNRDTEDAAPGIDGSNENGKRDGDDGTGNGDDVEDAHQYAES